jgi:integrase
MSGSVYFKRDRAQWGVAWNWQGKRYQISRYKGRLMAQTHPNPKRDQGCIDANRLLAQMQGDVENGVFRIEKYTGNRYTDVIPFFEQWLKTKENKKPATQNLYRNFFKVHIKPFFEANPVQLHEIQLDTLDALLSSFKLGATSAYLCMMCFRSFMDYAWRSKKIQEIPPFPKRADYGMETPAIKWLPETRQMAVINAIPECHRTIFLFLKYHIRRPAEAMSLHKIDYDRFNQAFHIRRSISGEKLVSSTKTRAEHIIPCHSAMIDEIERLIESNPDSPYIFVNRLGRLPGKRYTSKALNLIWRNACKVVGEDIDLYSGLKHSSMSQFVNEKRLSLAEVQIVSDHARMESVKKYASVELARKRELMETLSVVEDQKLRKVK